MFPGARPRARPGQLAAVAAELTAAAARVIVPSLAGFTAGGPPYAPRLVQRSRRAGRGGPGRRAGRGPGRPGRALGRRAVRRAARGRRSRHRRGGRHLRRRRPARRRRADAGRGRRLPALPAPRSRATAWCPPWPQWFPEAGPAELFPSEAARAAVRGRRPAAAAVIFLRRTVPPARPAGPGAGYLLFSAGYGPAAAAARQRGWPVAELPGSHLHILVAPAAGRPRWSAGEAGQLVTLVSW